MSEGAAGKMSRVERVADLLAYLLNRREPASLVEIVAEVPGYPADSEESARTAFERDKRLLREEGVPVTTVTTTGDLSNEDDEGRAGKGAVMGYLIRPHDYYLPDLGLTDDETVAINLALSSVQLDGAPAEQVQWKFGGAEAPASPLVELPVLPTLPTLRAAVRRRAVVRFSYNGRPREVHPYGMLCRDGFWYVSGPESGQGPVKHFRVDRIEGDVSAGKDNEFDPPAGFDPAAALSPAPWELGNEEPLHARVRIDSSMAPAVEADVGSDRVTERRPDGSVVVELSVVHRGGFRSWVLGLRDHAQVLAPPELVNDLVAWLEAIAGGQGDAATGEGP